MIRFCGVSGLVSHSVAVSPSATHWPVRFDRFRYYSFAAVRTGYIRTRRKLVVKVASPFTSLFPCFSFVTSIVDDNETTWIYFDDRRTILIITLQLSGLATHKCAQVFKLNGLFLWLGGVWWASVQFYKIIIVAVQYFNCLLAWISRFSFKSGPCSREVPAFSHIFATNQIRVIWSYCHAVRTLISKICLKTVFFITSLYSLLDCSLVKYFNFCFCCLLMNT